MFYELRIEDEFGAVSVITFDKDGEKRDELVREEARGFVEDRNKGSVAVKQAALLRLETIWSVSYKTDPDY